MAEIVDRIHEAANLPECDCDVDVHVRRTFSGYRLSPGAAAVRVAESALRSCGHEPVQDRQRRRVGRQRAAGAGFGV